LDEKTKQPIEAEIVIETLGNGKEVGVAKSSPSTGEFTIILPAGEKYGFLAENPKYMSEHQNLDLTQVTEYQEVDRDLFLVPIETGKTVVLNNIFFSPSKSELTKDSEPELNRVVKFMNEHPTVKIEVRGHTNNSCTEDWCIKLSTMRAKSVYDWLVSHGVQATRMRYKGYGSTVPRFPNDTAEGKRLNRRVEFQIVGL
jgi:outer membrane protein OmpA-like peptidoglycan-associated protein